MEGVLTDINIFEMVEHSSWMAKTVLLILLSFSILSWTIMVNKVVVFRLARREDDRFLSEFGKSPNLASAHGLCKELKFSPVAKVFLTGCSELDSFRDMDQKLRGGSSASVASGTPVQGLSLSDLKSIAISMDNTISQETERLGRFLDFLATTGSTTPFIGLFGTVWGIMSSFRIIGVKGAASIANVAPGIAEALVATAAGLVAAIPAVIFFNYLNGKIRWFGARMDNFSRNFICWVEKTSLHSARTNSAVEISPRK